jgi:DNA anti-recombination protein RmuC
MSTEQLEPYILFAIGVFFLFGLTSRWTDHRKKRGASDRSRMWPTAAVTAGIIGTFVGIWLGLTEFDINEIDDSLGPLLDGLKTAFLTSICGLIASLVLKLWDAGLDSLLPTTESSGGSEDPIVLLQKINENTVEVGQIIERVVRSEEEYSLPVQLAKIRDELEKTRKASLELSDSFLEKLVEQTSASLSEGIRQVVDAFDANLNERTAETFEELKGSVDAVVKWQTSHRKDLTQAHEALQSCVKELERATEAMRQSGEAIERLEPALHHISTSVDTVAEDSGALALAANQLRTDTERLQAMLSAIDELGASARTVIPALNERLEAYTSRLVETVETSATRTAEATERAGAAMEQSGERLIALQTEQEEKLGEHLVAYTKRLLETLEVTNAKTEGMSKRLNEVMEQSTARLTTLQGQQDAKLEESIQTLTRGLNEALTTSLEQLVGALGHLSERFVEDYGPLTERLREVVRLAEATRQPAEPVVEALYDPEVVQETTERDDERSAIPSSEEEDPNDG